MRLPLRQRDVYKRQAQDGEGRQVQQELERQLRELGDTLSDSFRHGFEGRGEEIGDRVWDLSLIHISRSRRPMS